jgi:hypothetical protein
MKQKFALILMVVVLVTLACQSSTPTAVFTSAPAEKAAQPTHTLAPTDTPGPTNTSAPTNTPAPTRTPRPTSTPKPTLTPTPVPSPLEFTGSGDQIVEVDKGDWPGTIHCVYNGGSNFVVINHDADGNTIDLLVNTIGKYEGTRILDGREGDHTTRLEVKASGDWAITIYPLAPEYVRTMTVPGTYSSTGDDVVVLTGGTPDLATFDHQGTSNFVVMAYGTGVDLLVNEIGNYHGQVIIPKDTVLFEVRADGTWTAEVTAK